MKIRLDKFLSSQLNVSRNDAKKLIKKLSVGVNGVIINKADIQIDTSNDKVFVDKKEISFVEHYFIMLNKPKGVVSSTDDNRDITVIDILPDSMKRNGLFPAGRLDKDTTGFVLITDDGEFAHEILSPAHHIQKTYLVEVPKKLSEEQEKRFLEGMKVEKDSFKPAELRFMGCADFSGNYIYEIKIVEGKYHQIKRMFAAVGNTVLELKRVAIGGLRLDEALSPGEARYLTEDELLAIKCK